MWSTIITVFANSFALLLLQKYYSAKYCTDKPKTVLKGRDMLNIANGLIAIAILTQIINLLIDRL